MGFRSRRVEGTVLTLFFQRNVLKKKILGNEQHLLGRRWKTKKRKKMTDGCHSLTCLNQPVVTSDVTKLKTQLHNLKKQSNSRTSKKQRGRHNKRESERASDTERYTGTNGRYTSTGTNSDELLDGATSGVGSGGREGRLR